MYCQNCGFNNDEGVNYCKRCGTNLNPIQTVKSVHPIVIVGFLFVILFITLAGFAMPMVAMSELHSKVDQGILVAFSALFLLAVFGVDAMLIWLLTRLLGVAKVKKQIEGIPKNRPKYVTSGQQYEALPAPPISVSSVTEHTTRNFDAVNSRERGAGETN